MPRAQSPSRQLKPNLKQLLPTKAVMFCTYQLGEGAEDLGEGARSAKNKVPPRPRQSPHLFLPCQEKGKMAGLFQVPRQGPQRGETLTWKRADVVFEETLGLARLCHEAGECSLHVSSLGRSLLPQDLVVRHGLAVRLQGQQPRRYSRVDGSSSLWPHHSALSTTQ